MVNYQAFSCLSRGYSHRDGVCQDFAGYSAPDENLQIAVVSDGHGDKSCFRSDVGSRLAVEVAIDRLTKFAQGLRAQGWVDRLGNPHDEKALMSRLKTSIVAGWFDAVERHLQDTPLTEEDLNRPNRYADHYRHGRHLPHIYGCTLIAAMRLEKWMLMLHVGDGRCVAIRQDCTAFEPVPWDEQCIGNVTTSMCHEDAHLRCRHRIIDLEQEPIVACFVTTDGIEDSFNSLPEQNGLFAYLSDVAARVGDVGIADVEEQMKEELPHISQYGSHDDTSFSALVDLEGLKEKKETLARVFEVYKYLLGADSAAQKLNSMRRKMDYLRNAAAAAERRLAEADREYHRAEDALQDAEKEYSEYSRLVDKLVDKVRGALDARWEPEEDAYSGKTALQLLEEIKRFGLRLWSNVSSLKQQLDDCEERKNRSRINREEAEKELDKARRELEEYTQRWMGFEAQLSAARKKVEQLRSGCVAEPEAAQEEEPEVPAASVQQEEPAAEETAPEQPDVTEEAPAPAEEEIPGQEEAPSEEEESIDWEAPRAVLDQGPDAPDADPSDENLF